MTPEEVLNYFGSGAEVGRALDCHRILFNTWRRRGSIPLDRQLMIEKITYGNLKASRIGRNEPVYDRNYVNEKQ